ncbi:MAG: ankyrin repeat domain-containing protein [Candidatus Marinimicrobia bacterium]|nr:ankyrin repeat domain-containing protein [Candidatus Neomarinimicrobiota bacterium]
MKIIQYNDLNLSGVRNAFDRTIKFLRAGDFRAADVKKLKGTPYYRAKLSDADRLLFRFATFGSNTFLLILEIIRAHAYEKSRFLNGASVDENKLELIPTPTDLQQDDALALPYVNPSFQHFHLLDKIISFDDIQTEAFNLRTPLILIGAAGSGKTVLTLEKLKNLQGDVLYVTRSAYLTENARNLYYAFDYENEKQSIDFLALHEYLETLQVPDGHAITFRDFSQWFTRYRHKSKLKDAHMLFEEFNGVLTGMTIDQAFLKRHEYAALGIKQSIFPAEQRDAVYDLFMRYIEWLSTAEFYDPNVIAYEYLKLCVPRYDFVVVDEVQDITNIQLHLILKSLRSPENFVLCGDSNQIVHPNFFSWSKVKTMFYKQSLKGRSDIIRVLDTNYRNSPQITEISNRLLLIKTARFGSIDRESNFLIKSVADRAGVVEMIHDSDKARKEINSRTSRSTRFAVIVMRPKDKLEVKRHFKTPLVFSVQEAKGLEYENIVLVNLVSNNAAEFNEITDGVSDEAVSQGLSYSRSANKSDKSLEAYKFYTNALYVALTRAIRNVYIIESHTQHKLWRLLALAEKKGTVKVRAQTSTQDEWKEEALKLEKQGKIEQAEAIRKTILEIEEVPWEVLTADSIDDLEARALNPDHFNKKAKQLLFEYAVTFHLPRVLNDLARLNFRRAENPEREQSAIENKYLRDYKDPKYTELNRKINLYDVDFPNALNQTPLMLASQLGAVDLVKSLINNGANPNLRDNRGRSPVEIALLKAYISENYANNAIGKIYNYLSPTSIKIKIDGRMIKIDRKAMEFFLLQSMLALFQEIVNKKANWNLPAFETADFIYSLQFFPEQVIPTRRKKRAYISSILAKNEVNRAAPYNRFLFVRVQRGRYILNPLLEIEVDGKWINVYDLLGISDWELEYTDSSLKSRRIQAVFHFVRQQQELASSRSKS